MNAPKCRKMIKPPIPVLICKKLALSNGSIQYDTDFVRALSKLSRWYTNLNLLHCRRGENSRQYVRTQRAGLPHLQRPGSVCRHHSRLKFRNDTKIESEHSYSNSEDGAFKILGRLNNAHQGRNCSIIEVRTAKRNTESNNN